MLLAPVPGLSYSSHPDHLNGQLPLFLMLGNHLGGLQEIAAAHMVKGGDTGDGLNRHEIAVTVLLLNIEDRSFLERR